MSNFITNQGKFTLRKRLNDLISASEEIKILVGFFYFSGINELYENLKANQDIQVKVLVGLNADHQSYGLVEYADRDGKDKISRIEDYHSSLIRALNNDEFDTQVFYEQAAFFIKMIQDGRLIIRKTCKPNHAKLYLFELNETQLVRNMFITGSSNLSLTGLRDQEEFNVEISDYGFEEALNYFDQLWEHSIQITENDPEREHLLKTLTEFTLLRSVDPFDAYMFVVKTWLDSFYAQESSRFIKILLERKGYEPYQYQIDAVMQALSIIEENGGVILADVVGLGKSIIACLIARKLDMRGLILCPPGLIGDKEAKSGWKKYIEDFELYDWEIRSSGDLKNVIQYLDNTENIDVVIIDEVHRFRNSNTESYEMLKTVCRGKIVIGLTATPFNNTPADILAMLSLFIVPKKSNISLNDNLADTFRYYSKVFKDLSFIKKNHDSPDPEKRRKAERLYQGYFGGNRVNMAMVSARAKYLSKEIRDNIEPVIIRRNRLDLLNDPDYQEELHKLSEIAPPKEWYYELTSEQSKFYDAVISEFFTDDLDSIYRFKGPIYKPYKYEGEDEGDEKLSRQEQIDRLNQDNLYNIIRRQLVKRFESSFGAFEQSVLNMKESYERILRFISAARGRYVWNRALINKADLEDPDTVDKLLKEFAEKNIDEEDRKKRIYDTNEFKFKDEFFKDIKDDIGLFDHILDMVKRIDLVKHDPKKAAFIRHMKEFLAQKPKKGEPPYKVVVFSEYADTVHYLSDDLEKAFKDRVLTIVGKISKHHLDEINTNFDAAIKPKHQKDDYDILLSTDKLSEGFNLNRAVMVVNYDIPWNPVRVIQRVGRINRISKKVFDTLYITNFFPSEKGASIVQSKNIATHKMFMIHQTLGEDARIFDIDEEPTPAGLFQKIQQDVNTMEVEGLYTRLKKKMREWEEKHPDRVKALETMPTRIKTAKAFREDSLVLFVLKGKLFAVTNDSRDEKGQLMVLPFDNALERIACDETTPALKLSRAFWENYNMLRSEAGEFVFRQSSHSNEIKASNMISTLLAREIPELHTWRSFLIMLREDIIHYGTLPDYTLWRIAEWEKYYESKLDLILRDLEKLCQELKPKYLDKVKSRLRYKSQQLIVAIENQKKER